jgi:hypothetical protein
MTKRTCSVAAGIAILGWSAIMAAQTAAPDPWKRVPASPASCYADDDVYDQVSKATTDIDAEVTRQAKLNADLKEKFEAMDISEKTQRMQAFMMKDPQGAMKMMQAMQGAGNATNSAVAASNADGLRLDGELTQHTANFNAAVDKVVKPLQAKQTEMMRTKTIPRGEAGLAFANAADEEQFVALVQQENTEYEKVCASFFGAKGTFPNWLAGYKTNIVNNVIVAQENLDSTIVAQMAIMGTPTGEYRSTAALEGVRTYLNKIRTVYALRHSKATASGFLRHEGRAKGNVK